MQSSLEIILPVFVVSLNSMLDIGKLPESWMEGLIFPLHKGGDRKDPGNYRRITVLPVMGN